MKSNRVKFKIVCLDEYNPINKQNINKLKSVFQNVGSNDASKAMLSKSSLNDSSM